MIRGGARTGTDHGVPRALGGRPWSRSVGGWLTLAALGTGLGCTGGDAPPAGRHVQRVIGGFPSGPSDDAVVFVRFEPPFPASSMVCSGSLIAPNLVVTALHCISILNEGIANCSATGELEPNTPGAGEYARQGRPEEIQVFAGQCGSVLPLASGGAGGGPANGGASPRCSTEAAAPTAFAAQVISTRSSNFCINDIAFVVLDRELPLPILPVRLDTLMQRGEPVDVLGYGVTEHVGTSGRYRRNDVRVVDIGADATTEFFSTVPPRTFTLGESVCHGDSGGPALTDLGAVAGVYSRSMPDCPLPYSQQILTCLPSFAALARTAFEAAGAEPWLEGEPPPGSVATAGAAGAAGTAGGAGRDSTGGAPGGADSGGAPPSPSGSEEPAGCCQTTPGRGTASHAGLLVALLAGLVAARRRRA